MVRDALTRKDSMTGILDALLLAGILGLAYVIRACWKS